MIGLTVGLTTGSHHKERALEAPVFVSWRRGRDSNPRYREVHTLSRRAPSTARTPLRITLPHSLRETPRRASGGARQACSLLRASCPAPLRGRLRCAAAFQIVPDDLVDRSDTSPNVLLSNSPPRPIKPYRFAKTPARTALAQARSMQNISDGRATQRLNPASCDLPHRHDPGDTWASEIGQRCLPRR